MLKIAKKYIFVPEICERGRMGNRRACTWLRSHGVDSPIRLQKNKYFGFRRQKVEKLLAEQEALHACRVAELKNAPDNERTRLAVPSFGPSAKHDGI